MLPNTLPLYSGTNAGSPTYAYASVGNATRVSDDAGRGEFRLNLGNGHSYNVVVQHSVQNGKGVGAVAIDRHTIRLSETKVNEASGAEDTASCAITIAAPRRGFTNGQLKALANGLLAICVSPDASSDPLGDLDNMFATNVFEQLLSGAV